MQMSDAVIINIASSMIAAVGTMFMGYIAYLMARLDKKAAVAAIEVKEVKTTLATTGSATEVKLNEIAQVGVAVHTLVNSNMGAQLKLNAVVSRRLAEITKDKEDIEAAELCLTCSTSTRRSRRSWIAT